MQSVPVVVRSGCHRVWLIWHYYGKLHWVTDHQRSSKSQHSTLTCVNLKVQCVEIGISAVRFWNEPNYNQRRKPLHIRHDHGDDTINFYHQFDERGCCKTCLLAWETIARKLHDSFITPWYTMFHFTVLVFNSEQQIHRTVKYNRKLSNGSLC